MFSSSRGEGREERLDCCVRSAATSTIRSDMLLLSSLFDALAYVHFKVSHHQNGTWEIWMLLVNVVHIVAAMTCLSVCVLCIAPVCSRSVRAAGDRDRDPRAVAVWVPSVPVPFPCSPQPREGCHCAARPGDLHRAHEISQSR